MRTLHGLFIAAAVVCATPTLARPQKCELSDVRIAACVGIGATGSATFCFGDSCAGGGVVSSVDAIDPPFAVTALQVDGPFGARAIAGGDFPVLLLPGERLTIEIGVVLLAPGAASTKLVVRGVGTRDGEGGGNDDDDDDLVIGALRAGDCRGDVEARAPRCDGGASGSCAGSACAAGACVPADGAPCGDACTAGGVCTGGACVGAAAVSCDDGQACTVDTCDPAVGCVHTAYDAACDDHDPCTRDRCDPARGCVHSPQRPGTACDDGNPCTVGDRCRPEGCVGDAMKCSDPFACTEERCVAGRCESTPVDSRCDGGTCAQASCRPGDPAADRRGCVTTPVDEGQPCTDDGVACTDDLCTDGGCLHVPVDTRCTKAGDCTPMACAPEQPEADASGCAPTAEVPSGDACAEDGDPCSEDVCRDGACRHEAVPDWRACAPVQGAFRKSLALVSLARGLRADVAGTSAATPAGARAGVGGMLTPLSRVETDLKAAIAALTGRDVAPATVAGFPETAAQARARTALAQLGRTTADERAFLAMCRTKPGRAVLGTDGRRTARSRGGVLLRGTKSLKAELRRLQQVSRTFAR